MGRKRRKKPEATSWVVPVRVVLNGECIVDANSAEEAIEAADGNIDIAANTRDSWSRQYLCGRLRDRGHDATLREPIKTELCDWPKCPHCGQEFVPIKRDIQLIDCDCGHVFEARKCIVSRPYEEKP